MVLLLFLPVHYHHLPTPQQMNVGDTAETNDGCLSDINGWKKITCFDKYNGLIDLIKTSLTCSSQLWGSYSMAVFRPHAASMYVCRIRCRNMETKLMEAGVMDGLVEFFSQRIPKFLSQTNN